MDGEKNRKKRWKVKQANKAFLKNPYEAGKKVLNPESRIFLNCESADLDSFKTKTLRDESYRDLLPPLEGLPPSTLPSSSFDAANVKDEDFLYLINSRRNGSSPGLNKIPYKVYKKCPKISSYLLKIFKSCVKLSFIPIQWRVSSEIYIPKKPLSSSNSIEDFRPIALLNVESKLFFS